VKWYRKAAEQGFYPAQEELGLAFEQGRGVPQDYTQAHKWYNLAAARGDTNAAELRDALARQMTPSQIAEAQRLSREFRSKKGGVTTSDSEGSASTSQEEARPTATGSGFFITEDGYLVTNAHVVEDAGKLKVLTSDGLLPARVVKRDTANDLAVLKVEGKHFSLGVAPSRSVKLGQPVATVGFPNVNLQGFYPKLARGEIASLAGAQDDPRYFQISVPVQPGNSGGALVNDRGNVVGVVSAKLSAKAALASGGALPENVNYAVKSSFLLGFLEALPEVSARLKEPETKERKFEDVVKAAEQAAVLVLAY